MGAGQKQDMKYINFLLCVIVLFCSCNSTDNKKTVIVNDVNGTVSLMPFINEAGDYGYINSETFEIVIPAQYEYAGTFTGDFAVVSKDKNVNGSYKPKLFIINKKNKKVLKNIHDAALFSNEEGTIIFALTSNYSGLSRDSVGEFIPKTVYRPIKTTYRIYNLNTGKLVLTKYINGYSVNNDDMPQIIVFSNYLACDNDLYEIEFNGMLKVSKIKLEDAVSQIIDERKLIYKESDFHYNRELFFDPYFWYFGYINLDQLFKIIPNNMGIRWTGEKGDWRFNDDKVVLEIEPINRNKIYPFKDNNLLYSIHLLTSKKNDRYSGPYLDGSKEYIGLYDALNNNWVIPPTLGKEITVSGYDDWILLRRWTGSYDTTDYYNIRKKKVYNGLFIKQFDNTMTYYGYCGDIKDVIIKDF